MTALTTLGLILVALAIGLLIAYTIRLLDLAGNYLKAKTAAVQAEIARLKDGA